MALNKLFFIFSFLSIIGLSPLKAQYQVNNRIQTAWMLLMDLKLDDAKQVLDEELAFNPQNYYAYYLQQTCDAYALLINSTDEEFDAFVERHETLREIMDGKYEDSPYYLFCKSEMDLQVGVFSIIHGSQFSGMRKAFSAYREVYKNLSKFPNFKPSLKLDGFFNVAISNLPPFVKWAVSVFGVASDFDYGMKMLHNLYDEQKNIKGINAEAALFIIFTAKINKTPEDVYHFTQTLDTNIRNLFIHQYFRTNIAYRTGHNEEALKDLKEFNGKNSSSAQLIYDYLKGKILLRKLQDSSAYYIESFLQHLKKPEYYKEMKYNLALSYLLKSDVSQYHELCQDVIKGGNEINERDREALYDASLDYQPHINLVKARLLIDGGYLDEAVKYLNEFKKNPQNQLAYQLEYHLLLARYQVLTEETAQAITNFDFVMKNGSKTDYYFACAASFYLGRIAEVNGKLEEAENDYKTSVDLYKSEYYEYLGDKANKALARVRQAMNLK